MSRCKSLRRTIKSLSPLSGSKGDRSDNIERTADDIVQVLPLKVITSLPNTNIADAVGRLPSVTLERDEGEGKYVSIRGTEPRLSNVTVNGSTCHHLKVMSETLSWT